MEDFLMDVFRKNIIQKIGENNIAKIERVRVGLAGAGGLGSNCAANLVRTGFRKLTIVDFDDVSVPNLDRQFYFMAQEEYEVVNNVVAGFMHKMKGNPRWEEDDVRQERHRRHERGCA